MRVKTVGSIIEDPKIEGKAVCTYASQSFYEVDAELGQRWIDEGLALLANDANEVVAIAQPNVTTSTAGDSGSDADPADSEF